MIAPHANASSPDGNATETVDPLEEVPFGFEPLPAGTLIAGRYEIDGLLGRGGYSAVYRARDRELKRDIALKIIRPERVSSSTELRLRREVNIARAAHSPHLVRVFDLGTDGTAIFLTMELVDGESLRQKLTREHRLGLREAIGIGAQMFRGLEALHSLKSIHRDIKPENVLIAADGTVKLADFGLARGLDDEQSRATVAGSVIGTADYLSPEQALGNALDERTDLYSAGVVLFEMLTGELPFVRESSLGSMIARIGKPARAVRSLQRNVPYWMAMVVSRLLDRDPARRFRSAGEVVMALKRGRIDFRRFIPRARTVAAALAVAAVASIGWILAPAAGHPHFARLASVAGHGIVAVGTKGETLWRRDGVEPDIANHYALVRIRQNAAPLLAAVLVAPGETELSKMTVLSFLDPESGVLRRQIRLPDAAANFTHDAHKYFVSTVDAVDLDGDGIDEVFVGYAHIPEAPSFTVLYEPLIDRSRVLFQAVGHHHFAGVHDIDGDGRPDAFFIGINNAFDWINAVTAIRIRPWVNVVAGDPPTATSPDMVDNPEAEADLLWYALLPRSAPPVRATQSISFDDRNRMITVTMQANPVKVTMDGFLASEVVSIDPHRREAHRRAAYAAYRESNRLFAVRAVEDSLREMSKAVTEAEQAQEAILVEALKRSDAALLIRAGDVDDGESLFRGVWQISENASEVAYDAGVAYHLAGNLDRALGWYELGLKRGAAPGSGKSKHEFAQAIILALAEQHRWQEAADAIERYRAAYSYADSDARTYSEYLRWRKGDTPHIEGTQPPWNATDIRRYWYLEFRSARGENPSVLLPSVEKEINVGAQPQGMWHSLRAELLWKLGRRDEAAAEASQAHESGLIEQTRSIIARAHSDIVQERYVRIAGGKGS